MVVMGLAAAGVVLALGLLVLMAVSSVLPEFAQEPRAVSEDLARR